jgi:dTDP-4-amino-4,6-dideoxygalactose transaminase
MIPFLSLKEVTALHGSEVMEAVQRVVNSGWYLQGQEVERFENGDECGNACVPNAQSDRS